MKKTLYSIFIFAVIAALAAFLFSCAPATTAEEGTTVTETTAEETTLEETTLEDTTSIMAQSGEEIVNQLK